MVWVFDVQFVTICQLCLSDKVLKVFTYSCARKLSQNSEIMVRLEQLLMERFCSHDNDIQTFYGISFALMVRLWF